LIDAAVLSEQIQQRIFDSFGYTVSLGVAPNKMLAKMCCRENRPFGITVLKPEYVFAYLASKTLSNIPEFKRKMVYSFFAQNNNLRNLKNSLSLFASNNHRSI
jgi:nucleotidyltransferase/DNA polymerase involved in DNA repair